MVVAESVAKGPQKAQMIEWVAVVLAAILALPEVVVVAGLDLVAALPFLFGYLFLFVMRLVYYKPMR